MRKWQREQRLKRLRNGEETEEEDWDEADYEEEASRKLQTSESRVGQKLSDMMDLHSLIFTYMYIYIYNM